MTGARFRPLHRVVRQGCFALAGWLALATPGAAAARLVAVTPSDDLRAVIAQLADGDVVQLAVGNYPRIVVADRNFGRVVTFRSVRGARRAVVDGLAVSRSRNITFDGVEFTAQAKVYNDFGLKVSASEAIAFKGVFIHGSLDQNPQNDSGGLSIRASRNITIENSQFKELYIAISELSNDNIAIRNNQFDYLRKDGIDNGGSSGVEIRCNSFTNFFPVGQVGGTGDHADAIQFWTTNTTKPAENITISGNVFVRGAGSYAQGIFIGNEWRIPYKNVVIVDNRIIGGQYNGVALSRAVGVVIQRNVIQPFSDLISWMRIEYVDGLQMNDNSAGAFRYRDNLRTQIERNTVVRSIARVASPVALPAVCGGV